MIKALSKIFSCFWLAAWVIFLIMGPWAHGKEPPRVAIFPFQFYAKESLDYLQDVIFVTLSGRLIEGGDVAVVERSAMRDGLSGREASAISDETVRKIATDLNAGYAITGTLTKAGELVDLEARLISLGGSGPPLGDSSQYRSLDAAMEGLGEFADRVRSRIVTASMAPDKGEKPSDKSGLASLYEKVKEGIRGEKPAPPQPTWGLETLHTLPTFLRGVGVGDVDGDGLNEIVLMDKRTLFIYKRAGRRLRLFRKIEGSRGDNFLTLDVADVNRNGLSEIIVSNIRKSGPRSFILEFEEQRIKKISDRERWFLRVMSRPTAGLTLVGQKMGSNRQPFGGIYAFAWTGKKYQPEKKPLIKKKRVIPVFSFNVADVEGRGEASIVYMDDHDQLRVLTREGAYRWESGTAYGGSDIFYSVGSQGSNVAEKRVYIPARLLVRDLDGDGIAEVIVSQNTFKLNIVERLRFYDRARLVNLAWRGMGLSESWGTPEISGYISDYQMKDVDNDGKDEIVLTAVSKGFMKSGTSSSVLVYELF